MRVQAPGFRIGAANGVVFSQSGRLLGQVGRRVAVYDVASRKSIVRSQWHYSHPAAAALGTQDTWLAVRSTTGAIAVVDIPSGQPLSRLPPETDIGDDSPLLTGFTGEHVVEACTSGILRIRRVRDLGIEYLEHHPADMLGPIASSATREQWVIAFNRKQLDAPHQPPCRVELRSWPLSVGDRRDLGTQFGYVVALALAPEGDRFAILEERRRSGESAEFILSVVSTATGSVEQQATDTALRGNYGFAWSPLGDHLIVGTDHGHALLDGRTLKLVGHLAGKFSSDAAFSPDGRLLALGYWGHGLVLPVAELESWFSEPIPASGERAV